MKSTVYVAEEDGPSAGAGVLQPAFRAWSDALMIRYAGGTGGSPVPAVAIRATARIARVEPFATYSVPVVADLSGCLTAISSEALRIYFPLSWTGDLVAHLVDQNYSKDLVEELVMPCAAPMVPIFVSKMGDVFDETPSELLDAIQGYFVAELAAYTDSITEISDAAGLSEDWEILIPKSIES